MDLLDRIDQLKKELENLDEISNDDQRKFDEKIRLEFNYNSNHIEGNTLTYGETKLLLIFDETKGHHALREYEEMKAHDVAFEIIKDWANNKEHYITEKDIKNLNEIILVRPFWKEAVTNDNQPTRRLIKTGTYKAHTNSVRLANGEIFEYASPIDTPIEMEELMNWYYNEKDALHPLTLAAMLHYKFVRIHPFDDGNGRIARLLMNYVFLKNNYPPVIIRASDKSNYLKALHLADVGDFGPFINYIGEQLLWSLKIFIKAIKGENIEEDEDWKKKLQVLKSKTDDIKSANTSKPSVDFSELISKIIFPFLLKIKDDFTEFDEVFLERQISIYSNNHSWQQLSENIVLSKDEINSHYYRTLLVRILFHDFRKIHNERFNVIVDIIFSFEHLSYTLMINNKIELRKLYNEEFTDLEIKLLKNKIASLVVQKIEEKISSIS